MINGPSHPAGKTWYRFANAATDADSTDVYIHDEIGGWGVYSTDFVRELLQIETSTVNVHINSPGGDIFEGLAIHNALMVHPSTVNTYVDGVAASAASFIVQAGKTRTMGKYATMMIHNPQAGVYGESTDMRKQADILDKLRDTLANLYADRSGEAFEAFVEMMNAETWFNSSEAIDFKLADVIDETADTKPTNQWDLGRVYNYAGRDQAPRPKRHVSIHVPVVPPTPPVVKIPDPSPEPDAPPTPDWQFDPEMFKAAVKIAANPSVPTDEAPFQWDPEVFKAVLNNAALTAPAVAQNPPPPEPLTFEQQYDPECFRAAVLEGISK